MFVESKKKSTESRRPVNFICKKAVLFLYSIFTASDKMDFIYCLLLSYWTPIKNSALIKQTLVESRSPPFPCIFSAVRHNSAVSQKSTRLSPPHTRHTCVTHMSHTCHAHVTHVHRPCPSISVCSRPLPVWGGSRSSTCNSHFNLIFFHFCFECCLSVPLWRTKTAKIID